MWTQEYVANEGQAKLSRYREEVKQAKMVRRAPFKSRLAQMLRGWAERLEPTPQEVDVRSAERAY